MPAVTKKYDTSTHMHTLRGLGSSNSSTCKQQQQQQRQKVDQCWSGLFLLARIKDAAPVPLLLLMLLHGSGLRHELPVKEPGVAREVVRSCHAAE
jgi:hypothetical protein